MPERYFKKSTAAPMRTNSQSGGSCGTASPTEKGDAMSALGRTEEASCSGQTSRAPSGALGRSKSKAESPDSMISISSNDSLFSGDDNANEIWDFIDAETEHFASVHDFTGWKRLLENARANREAKDRDSESRAKETERDTETLSTTQVVSPSPTQAVSRKSTFCKPKGVASWDNRTGGDELPRGVQIQVSSKDDIMAKLVAPFLDLYDVLMLRQTNRVLYFHRRFRLKRIKISEFYYMPETILWHYVLPLAARVSVGNAFMRFHIEDCSSITDSFVRAMFSDVTSLPPTVIQFRRPAGEVVAAGSITPDSRTASRDFSIASSTPETAVSQDHRYPNSESPTPPPPKPLTHVHSRSCLIRELYLDGAYLMTDDGLQSLLTTHFPFVEVLSMRFIRSNYFTGAPFSTHLSYSKWPRLHQFCGSFTHIKLEHVTAVAKYILDRSDEMRLTPRLGIVGSIASIGLIKHLDLEDHQQKFLEYVICGDLKGIDESGALFARLWDERLQTEENKSKILFKMMVGRGLHILVNAPCTMGVAMEKLRKQALGARAKELQYIRQLLANDGLLAGGQAPDPAALREVNLSSGGTSFQPHPSGCGGTDLADGLYQPPAPVGPFRLTDPNDFANSTSSRWTYPLLTAIRIGHRTTVKHLLDMGAKMRTTDYDHASPLYLACRYACQACDPNVFDDSELVGDMYRSADKDVDEVSSRAGIVKLLIERGCPVDPREYNCKKLPVNAAAKYDNVALLELLISYKAKVNLAPRSLYTLVPMGKPPLVVACQAQPMAKNVVPLLLTAGADPNWRALGHIKNSVVPALLIYKKAPELLPLALDFVMWTGPEGRSTMREIMTSAIMQDDGKTVSELATRVPVLLLQEHSMWSYPHLQASKSGKSSALSAILEANFDEIESVTIAKLTNYTSALTGCSALTLACSEGNYEAARLLLEHGADPNVLAPGSGYSPLHFAAEEDNVSLMMALLKYKAHINPRNNDGLSPLMLAIATRHEKFSLKMLEQPNIDLDIPDPHGRTLLMFSVFFGLFKVASVLIKQGAKCSVKDENGWTAEDLLRQKVNALAPKHGYLRVALTKKLHSLRNIGARKMQVVKSVGPVPQGPYSELRSSSSSFTLQSYDTAAGLGAEDLLKMDYNGTQHGHMNLHDDEVMRVVLERKRHAGQRLLKQLKTRVKEEIAAVAQQTRMASNPTRKGA